MTNASVQNALVQAVALAASIGLLSFSCRAAADRSLGGTAVTSPRLAGAEPSSPVPGDPRPDARPTRDTVVAGTRVTLEDTVLILRRDGAEARVPAAAQVGADSAVRTTLVDVRAASGNFYVLLYVDGASRAAPGARACAREAGLVWAAFDTVPAAAPRPRSVRGVRTASCAALRNQVEPYGEPPSAFKGVVNVLYDQQPGAERHNVWYAVRHPERGLHDEVLH